MKTQADIPGTPFMGISAGVLVIVVVSALLYNPIANLLYQA